MIACKRQAIDSVFVKANASKNRVVEKDILEDADQYATLTEDEATTPLKSIDTEFPLLKL